MLNLFSNEVLTESLEVFWYFVILNWTFCRVKGLSCIDEAFIHPIYFIWISLSQTFINALSFYKDYIL